MSSRSSLTVSYQGTFALPAESVHPVMRERSKQGNGCRDSCIFDLMRIDVLRRPELHSKVYGIGDDDLVELCSLLQERN